MWNKQRKNQMAKKGQIIFNDSEPESRFSPVQIERIIYACLAGLMGIIFGIARWIITGGFGSFFPGVLLGIVIVAGFYLLQSFILLMWSTWGTTGKILAVVLFVGVGMVILAIGDLIRWLALKLYKGSEQIYFAFSGWKSKAEAPKMT
jgi:hypothetical protein